MRVIRITRNIKPQTSETKPNVHMKLEKDTVQNSATRILQVDERTGPLLVHLNQSQWAMVKDMFRDVECGGNTLGGWNIWRFYLIDTSDYFLLVLLKHSNLTKTMFYHVSKDCLHFLCLNHSYGPIPVSLAIKGSKKKT